MGSDTLGSSTRIRRVDQNCIYAPCMTVYLVTFLPKSAHIHRHRWFWLTLNKRGALGCQTWLSDLGIRDHCIAPEVHALFLTHTHSYPTFVLTQTWAGRAWTDYYMVFSSIHCYFVLTQTWAGRAWTAIAWYLHACFFYSQCLLIFRPHTDLGRKSMNSHYMISPSIHLFTQCLRCFVLTQTWAWRAWSPSQRTMYASPWTSLQVR